MDAKRLDFCLIRLLDRLFSNEQTVQPACGRSASPTAAPTPPSTAGDRHETPPASRTLVQAPPGFRRGMSRDPARGRQGGKDGPAPGPGGGGARSGNIAVAAGRRSARSDIGAPAARARQPSPEPTRRLSRRRLRGLGRHQLLFRQQELEGARRLYQPLREQAPFHDPPFGVSQGDDPTYVKQLFIWVRRHQRCKMLILLPGLSARPTPTGLTSPAALGNVLHDDLFPSFRAQPPRPPAASPWRHSAPRERVVERGRGAPPRPGGRCAGSSCSARCCASRRWSLQSYRYDEAADRRPRPAPEPLSTVSAVPEQRASHLSPTW